MPGGSRTSRSRQLAATGSADQRSAAAAREAGRKAAKEARRLERQRAGSGDAGSVAGGSAKRDAQEDSDVMGEAPRNAIGLVFVDGIMVELQQEHLEELFADGTLVPRRIRVERSYTFRPSPGAPRKHPLEIARAYFAYDPERPIPLGKPIDDYVRQRAVEASKDLLALFPHAVLSYGHAGNVLQRVPAREWSAFFAGAPALDEQGNVIQAVRTDERNFSRPREWQGLYGPEPMVLHAPDPALVLPDTSGVLRQQNGSTPAPFPPGANPYTLLLPAKNLPPRPMHAETWEDWLEKWRTGLWLAEGVEVPPAIEANVKRAANLRADASLGGQLAAPVDDAPSPLVPSRRAGDWRYSPQAWRFGPFGGWRPRGAAGAPPEPPTPVPLSPLFPGTPVAPSPAPSRRSSPSPAPPPSPGSRLTRTRSEPPGKSESLVSALSLRRTASEPVRSLYREEVQGDGNKGDMGEGDDSASPAPATPAPSPSPTPPVLTLRMVHAWVELGTVGRDKEGHFVPVPLREDTSLGLGEQSPSKPSKSRFGVFPADVATRSDRLVVLPTQAVFGPTPQSEDPAFKAELAVVREQMAQAQALGRALAEPVACIPSQRSAGQHLLISRDLLDIFLAQQDFVLAQGVPVVYTADAQAELDRRAGHAEEAQVE